MNSSSGFRYHMVINVDTHKTITVIVGLNMPWLIAVPLSFAENSLTGLYGPIETI